MYSFSRSGDARMITVNNESLAKYSSFKTGGNADVILFPEGKNELIEALQEYPDAPVLGNMSNTLIRDGGVEGAVIVTTRLTGISVEDNIITAMAGTSLSSVALAARDASLTGAEFLYGIPGTVGGGVFMNAGAYERDISMILDSAELIDKDLNIIKAENSALRLGYRTSALQGERLILVSASFILENGDKNKISETMQSLMSRRMSSQPLDKPSCGSTFKRPTGHFAGKLIADCGLKGMTVGGAQVSEKHAGFIINKGGATSRDILELIDIVKKTVEQKTNVKLEEEIRIIGHD